MYTSIKRSVLVLGVVTLACSSGELTSPLTSGTNGGGTSGSTGTTGSSNSPSSIIFIAPTSTDVVVGTSLAMVAAVKDASGQTLSGLAITWGSADSSVVRVTDAGLLVARAIGTSVVTASSSGKSASLTINVTQVPIRTIAVSLNGSITVDDTTSAIAVARDSAGNVLTGRPIVWSSRDASIARVSSTGLVTGVSPGIVGIDGQANGVTGSATVKVTVPPISINKVTVSLADTLVAAAGLTTQASVIVADAAGNQLFGRVITWTSSNPGVATVSQLGVVTAVGVGTTVISATGETRVGSATFTVSPTAPAVIPVSTVTVTAPLTTLISGQTTTAVAVARDAGGSIISGRTVTWVSSNPSFASVSTAGLVTALAAGTATVTATVGGKTGSVVINSIVPPVATVALASPVQTISPSDTARVAIVLSDAASNVLTGRVIAWTSSAPLVATVSQTGLVTGATVGTTTITATSEGKSSTITFTVVQQPVKTVVVSATSTTLNPAQTTQAYATLRDTNGAVLSGRVVVWTTSNPAVATVSSTGVVTSVAAGSASIIATSEGRSGSVSMGLAPVATLTVTVANAFPLVGQTTLVSATPKDSTGTVLGGRTITYTSSNPAVATVSAAGLVTPLTTGSTVITATCGGVIGTVNVTVIPPVGSITVSAGTNSLMLGQSTQLTAVALDARGVPVTAQPVWTSSDPTKATVSTTGLVTAVNGGTFAAVRFTATTGSLTANTTINVTGHAVETTAALPLVFLNTTAGPAPDVGGVIRSATNTATFSSALSAAQPGDVIELANGVTYVGNFTLPNKNTQSTKWITIRPAVSTGMPLPGARMTPSIAAAVQLPIIQSPNNGGAINMAPGAHHYRLIGLEITVTPANTGNTGLIRFGEDGTNGQTTLASVPHDLVLDRSFVHGLTTKNVRRGVSLQSASTAIIDSYFSEIHELGGDAQAIAGWNGPGPYKITNNYLEASTENISFGGADPGILNLVPSDIEIRGNHFFKPVAWKGVWLVKNLFELKTGQRVLLEGNLLENNWQDGQGGSAINLKSTNQDGACPWCGTRDVTVRYNLIRNTGAGFSLAAAPDPNLTNFPLQRVNITDNVVANIDASGIFNGDGRGLLINQAVIDLTISHNTMISPSNTAVTFGGPISTPTVRLTLRDNIINAGAFGVKGPGLASGTASINALMPTGYWLANVLIIPSPAGYPTTSYYPATTNAIGFTNATGLDFHLGAGSAYRNLATDGRDPGANIDAINAAIANVIVP
jgi:uncharacterized protein YjdB